MNEALLRTVVEAQLGRHRGWEFYDRRQPTYLNLVLAHAEHRAGRTVNLVWVEGGFPEVFTLQGGGVSVPVFSTRYVEMSGVLRKILSIDHFDATLRREHAEYATLRLIGEMALRLGQADLAARCLALSALDRQIWVPDLGYNDYELPPYDEGYAAHWYFAVLHEIGHAIPSPSAGIVADGFMRAVVEVEGLDPDRVHRSLRPAELRTEIVADMFAATMLLETTTMIMQDAGGDFDPLAFIGECLLTAAVVEIVERCRRFVWTRRRTRRPPALSRCASARCSCAGRSSRTCARCSALRARHRTFSLVRCRRSTPRTSPRRCATSHPASPHRCARRERPSRARPRSSPACGPKRPGPIPASDSTPSCAGWMSRCG